MASEIIIFAREPVAGQVKTRLTPPLDPEEAVELYKAFVRDVVSLAQASGADKLLLSAASEPGEFLNSLGVELEVQVPGDLGVRMRHAFQQALARSERVVLIGSDSPSLPQTYLPAAFEALSGKAALVLGPATDGGYVLIGATGEVPEVFTGVEWSSERVMTQTLALAEKAAVDAQLLPFWYDVDTVDDLRWLVTHLTYLERKGGGSAGQSSASHTRAALEELSSRREGFLEVKQAVE